MDLQQVEQRTTELAESVGPVSTLLAMARLEDALEALDREVASDLGADEAVIDLREVRQVLDRTAPVLDRAVLRIEDMAGALDGR